MGQNHVLYRGIVAANHDAHRRGILRHGIVQSHLASGLGPHLSGPESVVGRHRRFGGRLSCPTARGDWNGGKPAKLTGMPNKGLFTDKHSLVILFVKIGRVRFNIQ